ncbi:MAG: hypothetical protein PHI50_00750 [Alphaproteobacteria bacterium]|nr:hypothetical protein [Alphaproteobacteria bacterium]
METLEQIAQEQPKYYAEMACKANEKNKKLSVRNGKLVLIDTQQPELSIQEKRALAYPSIQDQLDLLYWDKVNGTNNWADTITGVKEKYPKEVKK